MADDFVCFCVNGGVCLDHRTCMCPIGFEGNRCQQLYSDFVGKDVENDQDIVMIIIVLFVVLAAILLSLFLFWRIRSIQRRKKEEKQQRNRRQSKATIEGVCVKDHEYHINNNSDSTQETQIILCLQEGSTFKELSNDTILNV